MKTLSKLTVLFTLLLLSLSNLFAQDSNLLHDRIFDAMPGETLKLEGGSGDVFLTGWDKNQVQVKVFGNERAEERFDFIFERTSGGVEVIAKKEGDSWFNWGSLDLRFEVMVPSKFKCEILTSGGDIFLKGIEGKLYLGTSGGDVETNNSAGYLTAKTSGGDIVIKNHSGGGELKTSGGDIETFSVEGDISASTSGGDIKLHVKNGKVEGSTSGGDVSLKYEGANEGIELRTSGGDIKLSIPESTNADVYLKTSGGDFSIRFPGAKLTEQTRSKYEGSFNDGGPLIECKTTGGDIEIRVN